MLEAMTTALDSLHPAERSSRPLQQRTDHSAPLAEAGESERRDAAPERTGQEREKTATNGSPKDKFELSREAQEIRQLQRRDREVRAHEAAHAAAGGAYAGSPSYSYEKGPDGRRYATGGEVGIDISPVRGNPEATLQKAQQVRAAALAPAQPSAQDMKVAQKAQAQAMKARQEISEQESDPSALDAAQAASAAATKDPFHGIGGEQTPFGAVSAGAVAEGMTGMTTLDVRA
jgi:hypothetical protein